MKAKKNTFKKALFELSKAKVEPFEQSSNNLLPQTAQDVIDSVNTCGKYKHMLFNIH